jgi:hypothetical protein
MKLRDIIEKLNLEEIADLNSNNPEISGAYTSDLLSDVIANSMKDNIWITLQTHINILAVAKLKELAAIIIVSNRGMEKNTIEKAKTEQVILLRTTLNAFQISGKLYELGIR